MEVSTIEHLNWSAILSLEVSTIGHLK